MYVDEVTMNFSVENGHRLENMVIWECGGEERGIGKGNISLENGLDMILSNWFKKWFNMIYSDLII